MLTPPEPIVRSVPNMDCGVRRRAAIRSGTHAAGRRRLRRRLVSWPCPPMAAQGRMGGCDQRIDRHMADRQAVPSTLAPGQAGRKAG